MKISRLQISNFRGIKSAELYFEDHTLLIGRNNVGKSTICEALDLLLGPDRLHGPTSIDEFDFYNSNYLAEDDTPIPLRIEGILTDLSDAALSTFSRNIEFWHLTEKQLLIEGELSETDRTGVVPCVRLELIGMYDLEEDEFQAKTYYSHSPDESEGLTEVSRAAKRQIGFLYLRAIRTGSRALSLERGSLLDLLLKIGQFRPRLWEDVRKQLKDLDPPLDKSIGTLRPVLDNIEARIKQYISITTKGEATKLFVSQLTREHLRKTLAFFMSLTEDQQPVPFQKLGTGTLSTLVFALLSAIAEMKRESVIFAMEEPEMAVPPHTQRRIVNYLLESTNQSFVTSHSPYVIEKFAPEQILLLDRDSNATVKGTRITFSGGLKVKNFHREMRRSIAEAMLGRAVLVGEGITECGVLSATAEILESHNAQLYPMDLSGVSFIDGQGDGKIESYGTFFRSLGLKTYCFFDYKASRTEAERSTLASCFDISQETAYVGMERLLAEEISLDIQWVFLQELSQNGGPSNIPGTRPADDRLKDLTIEILKGRKGDLTAAKLIGKCSVNQLPPTVVSFLMSIYQLHPKPEPVPSLETMVEDEESESDSIDPV